MGIKLAVLGLVLVLLGVGLGFLLWGRGTTGLKDELARASTQLAEQSQSTDEWRSRFADAGRTSGGRPRTCVANGSSARGSRSW